MSQTDATNVKWSTRRKIRFAIGCLVVTVLSAAGLVVIGMAEGNPLLSLHYLITLVWTSFGIGWSMKVFREWSRLGADLQEMQKEIWTTTDVERRVKNVGTRGGTSKRYELIVDGETFVLPHHRLDELGYSVLQARRSTTVEVSRHGRELLAVQQAPGPGPSDAGGRNLHDILGSVGV